MGFESWHAIWPDRISRLEQLKDALDSKNLLKQQMAGLAWRVALLAWSVQMLCTEERRLIETLAPFLPHRVSIHAPFLPHRAVKVRDNLTDRVEQRQGAWAALLIGHTARSDTSRVGA